MKLSEELNYIADNEMFGGSWIAFRHLASMALELESKIDKLEKELVNIYPAILKEQGK